ncbi:unnamed protein product [Chondrus crispus]|uniref:Uncharacterized protein n=1 Tax=Chondrus crispus TaxID=2769 RepID=R7QCE1_CHOCR|nr:unnamed protein product [Chondrus crispus]CDF35443.1 unnamed protein product [Chondrus crispus]|eukprot:XP_005715262.1 unnamed protein product [Chondrus crispus]
MSTPQYRSAPYACKSNAAPISPNAKPVTKFSFPTKGTREGKASAKIASCPPMRIHECNVRTLDKCARILPNSGTDAAPVLARGCTIESRVRSSAKAISRLRRCARISTPTSSRSSSLERQRTCRRDRPVASKSPMYVPWPVRCRKSGMEDGALRVRESALGEEGLRPRLRREGARESTGEVAVV